MINRRHLLGSLTGAACVCSSAHGAFAHFRKPDTNGTVASPHITPVSHSEVRLGEGILADHLSHNHSLYLGLDNDALLKPFRQKAGMNAPGADMGGWYDISDDFLVDGIHWDRANWHGYIPGHSFGQYVSGLSRAYAIAPDAATKNKITTLVGGYAETLSPKFFEDYNLPAYTYDKLVVGLIDAYGYAGLDNASTVLARLTETAVPFLPEKALSHDEIVARPHKRLAQTFDESYTLPENLFLASQRGMGSRYHDMALRYVDDSHYFGPLARGVSSLGGVHAYSHVNGLSSAIQTYLATGDVHFLNAAKNGFAFIEAQSFATGGWGPNEGLFSADDQDGLYNSLSDAHASFETPCGVYGHFKIARSLLSLTGDSHYGDSMERILINTIMGARPTSQDGRTFYYSDYTMSARKSLHHDQWPCCSGTFFQLATDYGISAYLRSEDALMVNLYAPSHLKTLVRQTPVEIVQTTDYPLDGRIQIMVNPQRRVPFALKLRIPAWAGPKTRLEVNAQAVPVRPGRFATLNRTWSPGDQVGLYLDMGLRLEALNAAHPDMVALLTGPMVLFPVEDGDRSLRRSELLSARQGLGREWLVQRDDRQVSFKPFMQIEQENYRLYSRLTS